MSTPRRKTVRSHRSYHGALTLAVALLAGCGGGGDGTPAPSALSYASPDTFAVGVAINPLKPTVTGTASSYSVSPPLPAGLTLNPTTGQITGTPTAAAAQANYTVTAGNSGGASTFALSLAVADVVASPSRVSRLVASGTPIAVTVSMAPVNFSFSGHLAAKATDSTGVFSQAVAVSPGENGSYTLTLAVSTAVAPSHYTGDVTLSLCADSACTQPQIVPSARIPFDINVMTANSAWPGNNLTALSPWPVADWTLYQGNAAHTGYVPVDVDPNQFSTRWQAPAVSLISDAGYQYLDSVTTSGGQLFFAGGTVLSVRKEMDGSLAWQHDFSNLQFPSVNPPAVANGVVYVAAGQQSSTYMFAFNATDGSMVFQSPMMSQWEHYLAPTIGPNTIYTNAGEYGGMYAFGTTGQQLFFDGLAAGLSQFSAWTPALDANHLYAYTGGLLAVLDPASGAQQMSIVDPTFQNSYYEIGGAVVLGQPDSVFVANYTAAASGNTLIDFNLALSSIAWKVSGAYPSTPAYNAGVLYLANNKPLQVEARSETDGSLLWSWTPPLSTETRFSSEVLLTTNLLFVSTDQAIYGIDLKTHQAVWSYPTVGRLALSQNGILYVAGASTVPLIAINLK